MNIETLLNQVQAKNKGAFFNIEYVNDLPLNAKAKKLGIVATKTVINTVRYGIDYDHQKAVQNKIKNGKELTHELPWGAWSTEPAEAGLIINHKGNKYIRLYTSPNKPKVEYQVNGIPVSFNELRELDCLVNSFFNKKSTERSDALTINIKNIINVF